MAGKKGKTKTKKGKRGAAKKKQGLPFSIFLIGAIVVLLAGSYLFLTYGKRYFPSPLPEKKIVEPDLHEDETKLVKIFFSNKQNLSLVSEKRTIKRGRLEEEVKMTLDGLVQGSGKGLVPTIPDNTVLLGVNVTRGIAFVNFSKELSLNHPGGSAAELHTVYSIVNTLTFNFPEIKEVQILINGKKEETLKGHIDISSPLKGEQEFVKG